MKCAIAVLITVLSLSVEAADKVKVAIEHTGPDNNLTGIFLYRLQEEVRKSSQFELAQPKDSKMMMKVAGMHQDSGGRILVYSVTYLVEDPWTFRWIYWTTQTGFCGAEVLAECATDAIIVLTKDAETIMDEREKLKQKRPLTAPAP